MNAPTQFAIFLYQKKKKLKKKKKKNDTKPTPTNSVRQTESYWIRQFDFGAPQTGQMPTSFVSSDVDETLWIELVKSVKIFKSI